MAEVNEKVMALVEAELKKNPDTSSGDLFEKAKAEVPDIGSLTLRQFHARYPLQIKRRASAASGSGKKKASKPRTPKKKAAGRGQAAAKAAAPATPRSSRRASAPTGSREAVRAVLMRFATELASADEKAEVVKVLAGADRYVDDFIAAAGS